MSITNENNNILFNYIAATSVFAAFLAYGAYTYFFSSNKEMEKKEDALATSFTNRLNNTFVQQHASSQSTSAFSSSPLNQQIINHKPTFLMLGSKVLREETGLRSIFEQKKDDDLLRSPSLKKDKKRFY